MSYATEKAQAYLRELLTPRVIPPPAEWLEKKLSLVDPNRNIDGPVRWSRYPYAQEPTEACCDVGTPVVALCFSAQMLKTTILMMAASYLLATREQDTVWAMDSLQNGRDFSKGRWRPLLLNNPVMRALLPANEDDFGNTEQYLKNGSLFFVGANSPGKAASKPCGLIINDEIDKWPDQHTKEAGTLDLLRERLAGNPAGMERDASTPTYIEGKIYQTFLQLDQRHRYGPCPSCGEPFRIEFSAPEESKDVGYVAWDQDARTADGNWKVQEAAASAHIVCPHCGFHLLDRHKRAFDRAAQWVPLNDNPARRGKSYRIHRLYSPLPAASLGNAVTYHLNAGNDPSARQTFSNSWLAEPYGEDTDSEDPQSLLKHLEEYPLSPLPKGVLLLTCGVDVQKGVENDLRKPPRLEAEIVGYGDGLETWGIEKRVFVGDPTDLSDRGPWHKLHNWLTEPRIHASGEPMPIACTLIDAGFLPELVYEFCATRFHDRIFPCKGKTPGQRTDPIVSKPQKSNIKHVSLFQVSRYSGNIQLYQLMKIKQPGQGYMHFPNDPSRGYSLEYFQQLTSEQLIRRRHQGRVQEKWENGGRATEALACRRYAQAAYYLANPDIEGLKKQYSQ